MTPNQRAIIFGFLKAQWKDYLSIFILSAATAAIEASAVVSVIPFFRIMLDPSQPAGRVGLLGRFIEKATALLPFSDPLAGMCALIIGLTLGKSLMRQFTDYRIAQTTAAALYNIKKMILDCYARAPYQYFLSTKQGRMAYIALTGSLGLAFLLQKVPKILTESLRVVLFLGLLFWLDYRVTSVLLLLGALIFFALSSLNRLTYHYGAQKTEASAEQAVIFNEFVNGIKQLTVFGVKKKWLERFHDASRAYGRAFVKNLTLQSVTGPFVETAAMTMIFGSVLTLKWLSPAQITANLPLMAGFAMAAVKLLPSFTQISVARMEFISNLPDMEAVHSVREEIVAQAPAGQGRRFTSLSSGIRLAEVDFNYPEREKLLHGVSLEIPKNKTLAIIGESGSGKTTLLNLLLGLYQPTRGRILIDGVDLQELDMGSWLVKIAVVTQDTFIHHPTSPENIVFWRSGYNPQAIREAAETAQAHEFISALPSGYDPPVGERGMKLSGGQQQRLAIARAVLGNPEIMIFDEATSALDTESESAVQSAIASASQGRTVILVSHRLSTLSGADFIAVIHAGRIEEQGPRKELLQQDGRYARLMRLQTEAGRQIPA